MRLLARSGAAYQLVEPPYATGGEALVYEAVCEDDGRVVAVRVALAPGPELPAQAELARRAGPLLMPVWDEGAWEGRPFMVLDWCPSSLADPVGSPRAAALALVRAVRALHAAGMVHGDIKPSNARVPEPDADPPAVLLSDPRPPGMPGHTPGYAPPEQERSGVPTQAADRYALAVTVGEVCPGVPGLAPVLRRLRHPDPRRRPDLADLDRCLAGLPVRTRRPRALALSLACLAATPGRARVEQADALVAVPHGRFEMGRDDDPQAVPDAPTHPVAITRPFLLGRAEVTQAEWVAVTGSNPVLEREQVLDGGVVAPCSQWKGHPLVGDDLPVVCVSFLDVVRWLDERSRRDGLDPAYTVDGDVVTWDPDASGWRLPTEAEWEWAAHLGAGGARGPGPCGTANLRDLSAPEHWGNEAPCDDGRPVLARAGEPDAIGLSDMEGNALEWVWDLYGPYPAERSVDPAGPASGVARVLRGASWNHVPRGIRARYAADPHVYSYTDGFRIARNAE